MTYSIETQPPRDTSELVSPTATVRRQRAPTITVDTSADYADSSANHGFLAVPDTRRSRGPSTWAETSLTHAREELFRERYVLHQQRQSIREQRMQAEQHEQTLLRRVQQSLEQCAETHDDASGRSHWRGMQDCWGQVVRKLDMLEAAERAYDAAVAKLCSLEWAYTQRELELFKELDPLARLANNNSKDEEFRLNADEGEPIIARWSPVRHDNIVEAWQRYRRGHFDGEISSNAPSWPFSKLQTNDASEALGGEREVVRSSSGNETYPWVHSPNWRPDISSGDPRLRSFNLSRDKIRAYNISSSSFLDVLEGERFSEADAQAMFKIRQTSRSMPFTRPRLTSCQPTFATILSAFLLFCGKAEALGSNDRNCQLSYWAYVLPTALFTWMLFDALGEKYLSLLMGVSAVSFPYIKTDPRSSIQLIYAVFATTLFFTAVYARVTFSGHTNPQLSVWLSVLLSAAGSLLVLYLSQDGMQATLTFLPLVLSFCVYVVSNVPMLASYVECSGRSVLEHMRTLSGNSFRYVGAWFDSLGQRFQRIPTQDNNDVERGQITAAAS